MINEYLKIMCSLLLFGVLKILSRYCRLMLLFSYSISLMISCLVFLINFESEVLKCPSIIVNIFFFPNSTSFCLTHFAALLFDAYIFRISMYFCEFMLYHYIKPFFLVIYFCTEVNLISY